MHSWVAQSAQTHPCTTYGARHPAVSAPRVGRGAVDTATEQCSCSCALQVEHTQCSGTGGLRYHIPVCRNTRGCAGPSPSYRESLVSVLSFHKCCSQRHAGVSSYQLPIAPSLRAAPSCVLSNLHQSSPPGLEHSGHGDPIQARSRDSSGAPLTGEALRWSQLPGRAARGAAQQHRSSVGCRQQQELLTRRKVGKPCP